MTFLAFLLRNWGHLQLAFAVTSLLMLSYFIVIPESPRWLMDNGKFDQADKILRDIAKTNHFTIVEAEYKVSQQMDDWRLVTSTAVQFMLLGDILLLS